MIALSVVIAFALLGAGYWQLSPVEHLSSGRHESTFAIDCDFDKYRQIMVRKNAAKAIVANSGMELVNEKIQDVAIDTSNDDRPLLNAIRGKSKTELTAVKLITVRVNNDQLNGELLTLKQHVDVKPDHVNAKSVSIKPAGRLNDYRTALSAVPSSDGTQVTLAVDMNVLVRIPRQFTKRADKEVQEAAEQAVADQRVSMEQFVAEHADAKLILPEFLSK